MEVNDKTLTEILRLTEDTNRTVHKMRRGAVWGTVIKVVVYLLALVVIPLWLYSTYLAPIMEDALNTYQQIQGTGAKAQAQFSDLQNMLNQLKQPFSSQE